MIARNRARRMAGQPGLESITRYSSKPEAAAKLDIRERLLDGGAPHLSDDELVAAVLGSGGRGRGVRDIAYDVLEVLDSAPDAPTADRLLGVSGIGGAKACQLAAALELGRRLYGLRERRIGGPEDVFPIVAHWADRDRERFISVTLNGAHEVIRSRVVTVGLVNRTVVHPREVFADAIADRACALVVAHNHPSGRLDPSPEDIEITEQLRQAGAVLGVPVLDHVIFTCDGYCSFAERGLLNPTPARSSR